MDNLRIHIKSVLFIGTILCVGNLTYGQAKIFTPKGSFGVDIAVPTKANNAAFQRTFQGLFNGGLDYQYNVYKGITVGMGLKYALFNLNSFAFDNAEISGAYHMPGAYLTVGYEKFTNERVSINFSVRAGYSFLLSANDSCTAIQGNMHVSESVFVEPQIEVLLLSEKISPHGFSFQLGYSIYFNEFNQSELCMTEIKNILPEDYQGITRYLSIGFGYRYYFGRN